MVKRADEIKPGDVVNGQQVVAVKKLTLINIYFAGRFGPEIFAPSDELLVEDQGQWIDAVSWGRK